MYKTSILIFGLLFLLMLLNPKGFKVNHKLLLQFAASKKKYNLWEFVGVQVTNIIPIVSPLINYILKTKAVK